MLGDAAYQDGTAKLLLRLQDGLEVECVAINHGGGEGTGFGHVSGDANEPCREVLCVTPGATIGRPPEYTGTSSSTASSTTSTTTSITKRDPL